MRLYLKKDSTTQLSRFVVLDNLGKEVYFVLKRDDFHNGSRIITDINFNKLCSITSIPLPFMKAYTIKDSKDIVRLVFNKNINRFVCYYYGISWRFRGDIITKNFEIVDHDNTVLLTQKNNWNYSNDGFQIDILYEDRALLLLSSAVCIDQFEVADTKQLLRV